MQVYKSSSKRKAHILKNHPGAELPASRRKRPLGEQEDTPGIVNCNFSQTTGSVTTMPHGCEYCHKQYASKAYAGRVDYGGGGVVLTAEVI